MSPQDAFERHCDRFVMLCNQVVLPRITETLDVLEAQGWLCDVQVGKGEAARRHRGPVEPDITLTLLLLGGGAPVRAFVRLSGNYARQGVDVVVGRAGRKPLSATRPMHEVTPELVDALVEQVAASAGDTVRADKELLRSPEA
jgi:hypothetical protein